MCPNMSLFCGAVRDDLGVKTQVHIARAAAVAFANTGESMKELVLGRKAISKPPGLINALTARGTMAVR